MATPTDTREPIKELLKDASFTLKWTSSANIVRIATQIATGFMWWATSDFSRSVETGEMQINVTPETSKFYSILGLMNLLGSPLDFTYFFILNTAKDGNTKAIAQGPII